jgi:hypothetical protein
MDEHLFRLSAEKVLFLWVGPRDLPPLSDQPNEGIFTSGDRMDRKPRANNRHFLDETEALPERC